MSSSVFIAGYTEFITKGFLEIAFPDCRIVISGGCGIRESAAEKLSRFDGELTASACRSLFHTYDFRQVVFFSQGLAPFGQAPGQEIDILSNLLSAGYPETKILYVAGPEHLSPNPLYLRETSLREICRHLAVNTAGIQFLVSPWIYQLQQPDSTLSGLFLPGLHKLEFSQEQEIRFLAAEDLAVLLLRMFEDWEDTPRPFYLPAGTDCTLKELTDLIGSAAPKAEFQFSEISPEPLHPADPLRLRSRYLWFPVNALEKDLQALAQQIPPQHKRTARSSFPGLPVRILELLSAGALCELLLQLSNVSIQFQMVDFRLLTIVILGSMYNIPMGLAAALMESICLVRAYTRSGTDWLTLFHEPTNWLPFIAFFTVGAICGYLRSRDRSLLKFAQEENRSLTERYTYLRKINDDVLREKQEYKQQIIGSRDSFGKLFHIAQQLNMSHPKHLLARAVDVMETIMDGSTIAIYNCGSQQPYGRLTIASRGVDLPYSLTMGKYYACLEPLSDGEPWVNRMLEPGMPQYLYGIRKDDRIVLVLMVQKADYNQMSLYHENVLRIVCGLISNSLVRAMEYQDAIQPTRCVEGSQRVLNQEHFLEELDFAVDSAEQKQATHLLLQLDNGTTLPEVEEKLGKCIRTTDIVGYIGSSLYVLLLQAKQEDMPFIGKRFASEGLTYALISPEHQRHLMKKEELVCTL